MSSRETTSAYQLDYPFEMNWAPEPGEPFEVHPNIFWLNMPLPFTLGRINLWLLRDATGGTETWTIVDTGMYGDIGKATWNQVFENFLKPEQVERIIVTHFHPDHLGLAEWLSAKCDAPVLISRGEFAMYDDIRGRDAETLKPIVENFVDSIGGNAEQKDACLMMGTPMQNKSLPKERCIFIDQSFKIRIGEIDWEVVAGNGHSPEHMCLYAKAEKIFISGDQAIPRISSNVSLFYDSVSENPMKDWLESCERLRDEVSEDVLVLPAHQEPFIGLSKRMQKLIDGHSRQLELVDQGIHSDEYAGKNAVECSKILFPRKLEKFDSLMAVGETLANLRFLERNDRIIARVDEHGVIRFYPKH